MSRRWCRPSLPPRSGPRSAGADRRRGLRAARRAIIGATVARPEDPPLDIIFLLERLESIIATGKALPLTKSVVVDREALLDLIDQLRVAIPDEVRAAKRINAESERIIETATEESERTLARAQEQAAFLIGERGLLDGALAEGRRITDQAEADAEGIRRGADDYAADILETIRGEVERALLGIRKGIAVLDDRRADLREVVAEEIAAGDEDEDEDESDEDDDDRDDRSRESRAW